MRMNRAEEQKMGAVGHGFRDGGLQRAEVCETVAFQSVTAQEMELGCANSGGKCYCLIDKSIISQK